MMSYMMRIFSMMMILINGESSEKSWLFLIITGILLIIIGVFLTTKIKLGKLPGDIIIKKDNFVIYIPITTMLIISCIISFILYLINKFC